MKRRQFPVKLSLAMAINKAQGQSINNLGINLPQHSQGRDYLIEQCI